ncbi:Nn.00g115970.m01.CDS01 [Neocucurbitaria sp. VM-36]
MSSAPTVLYPLTLPELLHHILTTQSNTASTTLIICSSRNTFLQDLASSLRLDHGKDAAGGLEQMLMPTLHNLFTTRLVKVAFCASVQALLAYLTAYGGPGTRHVGDSGRRERLVLVNPLALHATTPAFSAQGLSRTFAAAAETALRTDAMLHVIECQGRQKNAQEHGEEDTALVIEDESSHAEEGEGDPWEQEVSILNVSARRFGSGTGEKAWAGRTIKAKRIVGRWFRFHKVEGHQEPDVSC